MTVQVLLNLCLFSILGWYQPVVQLLFASIEAYSANSWSALGSIELRSQVLPCQTFSSQRKLQSKGLTDYFLFLLWVCRL